MPSKENFLRAFEINTRLLRDNKVLRIISREEVVEEYFQYEFPITIIFENPITKEQLYYLREKFRGSRTAYSRYNNPYECVISRISYSQKTLQLLGVATRIYHTRKV